MSAVLEINEETAEVLTKRAKVEGQSVDEYLKTLLTQNEEPIAPQKASDAEVEADMEAFAEGSEHLQPYARTSILIMTDGVPSRPHVGRRSRRSDARSAREALEGEGDLSFRSTLQRTIDNSPAVHCWDQKTSLKASP